MGLGNIELLQGPQEHEKRFTDAFNHAPIGMALVALSGEWLRVNHSLCTMLGYSQEEFLQHSFQDFTHPDDLEADVCLVQQLIADEIPSYSLEKRYFHANGSLIWAQLNVSLVRSEQALPLYFVSQIKDITERKMHLETIRQQNERLMHFAQIVSHNLRSHTANMKMLTEMILQEGEAEEQRQMLQYLNTNATELIITLDNLNEVISADNYQAGKTMLVLKLEIQRVLGFLGATIRETQADIRLDIPEDLTVRYNPAYLESIIINLVSNSLKYREPSRKLQIVLTATLQNKTVTLGITDNGRGIDLARHGQQLFGLHQTFHNHPEARGMGLFLVKSEVRAMGGDIWAESECGKGTTFFITLPFS